MPSGGCRRADVLQDRPDTRDPVAPQGAGEVVARELAALVGVEDLGTAVPGERVFEGLDTELRTERVRRKRRSQATALNCGIAG